jgi:hypothetical protein
MFDPQSYDQLKHEIHTSLTADRQLLDQLREEIRPLRYGVRRIQPRSTTSISLVAADGGNNSLRFDPFLIQIVRVVDSSNNEYCLEAVTPTTDIFALSAKQFTDDGTPLTPLGELMDYLGVRTLPDLCPMIRRHIEGSPTNPYWVAAYRELVEWAILFRLIRRKDFATDTLIVFDGLLRSFYIHPDLFPRFADGLREGIERQYEGSRRRLYLVGVAKDSKVLDRYRLSMAVERVLTTDYPAYLEVPLEVEEKAYLHTSLSRGEPVDTRAGRINKNVAGQMFFVKFGTHPRDPIWPVDVFLPQTEEAQAVMGYLLADALDGFPVPFYPQCLQKAHHNAALVDFDFDILQDQIFEGIRNLLGEEAPVLDAFHLFEGDPSARRYG